MKISFTKSRLNDIIRDLRDWNGDLQNLRNQINTHKDIFRLEQSGMQKTQKIALQHLKITKDASNRLYDILACKWCCDERIYHVASLDLLVDERCMDLNSKVRFRLGFACWRASGAISLPQLWLAIESTPNESHTQAPKASIFVLGSKLQGALEGTVKEPRHVRIELPDTIGLGDLANEQLNVAKEQKDLDEIDKLCDYIRKTSTPNMLEPCVGLLGKKKTFKHLVYHTESPMDESSDTKTLKDLLQQAYNERRQFEWVDKLNLARVLALSVLRFNSTSWLPKSWGSNDISFFEQSTERNTITSPHLSRTLLHDSTEVEVPANGNDASAFAANSELFSLAVVLIELGFDGPFNEISSVPPNLAHGDRRSENFFAAIKLASKVHGKFNKTYGDLVEKCLRCNFGVATTLDKAELQSAVLVHVVNQLDVCLEKYKEFQGLVPPRK